MTYKHQVAIGGIVSALLAAAAIAGCGGGGGGTSTLPGPRPSPTASATPGPSPTPVLTGNMNVAISGTWPNPTLGGAANAEVDFTCGCTNVAGTGTADGSGNFTVVTNSTPVPTPNPNYTIVPGRNYIVIATSTLGTAAKAQAWTIMFAGNDTTRNQYLSGTNASDTLSAAVAMYVFFNSTGGNALAFDDWNFDTLKGFYTHLQSAPTAAETQLLTDIVAQQEAGNTMYPSAPTWRAGRTKNHTIETDLAAITPASDPAVPTPCPTPAGGGPAACTSPYPTP